MKFREHLEEIYAPAGNEWVNRNGFVFYAAKQSDLSIAGSIAISLGRKKSIKIPGDIDFVCDNNQAALEFVDRLQNKLLSMSVYWRVQFNSKTEFCPDGCSVHIRFTAPFWLPICVMVVEKVNFWRTNGGNQIQSFNDVIKAAKELDERDGKGRVPEDLEEWVEPREPVHQDLYEEEPSVFERLFSNTLATEDNTYKPKP